LWHSIRKHETWSFFLQVKSFTCITPGFTRIGFFESKSFFSFIRKQARLKPGFILISAIKIKNKKPGFFRIKGIVAFHHDFYFAISYEP